MSAVMSPLFIGVPSVKTGGAINSGGTLYTYVAGTTTPFTTYTDNTLGTSNGTSMTFNSYGLLSNEVWWNSGASVKFIVKDSDGNTLGTYDNITGLNDASIASQTEWVSLGLTPTYTSATTFTVPGNQTSVLPIGRRIKTVNTAGTIYSTITGSSYAASTTITVVNDSGTLDSGLSSVAYGFLSPTSPSAPTITGLSTASLSTDIDPAADYVSFLDSSTGQMKKVFFATGWGRRTLAAGVSLSGAAPINLVASGLSSVAYNDIEIIANGWSLNGTDNIIIQLADDSGFLTTGYTSRGSQVTAAAATNFSAAGFVVMMGAAAATLEGVIYLTRRPYVGSPGGDRWAASAVLTISSVAGTVQVSGTMDLNSASPVKKLDGIRLNVRTAADAAGANTFDAGTADVYGYY